MNVNQVLATVFVTLLGVLSAEAEEYRISIEDAGDLEILNDEYNTVQHGGHWAKCRQGRCYIMETGELISDDPTAPDGIYLVFPEGDRQHEAE